MCGGGSLHTGLAQRNERVVPQQKMVARPSGPSLVW